MTLKEYYEYLKLNNKKLLSIKAIEKPNYLQDYVTNYENIFVDVDMEMVLKNADRVLIDSNFTEIESLINSILNRNNYYFTGLYESMHYDYNPIWNVDGTETITNVYGVQTEVKSNSYGEHVNTSNIGGKTDTSNEFAYPYDNANANQTEKSEFIEGSKTDTHTSQAHDDVLTTEIDTHTDSVTNVRSGNIGVTSTQNLIKQERDVVNLDFWELVYSKVINEISYGY